MAVLIEKLGRAPKALLFDLDGTLIDSVPDLAKAIDAMLSAAQLPLAGEQRVRAWVGNGARQLVLRALAHAHQCAEEKINTTELNEQHQQFLNCYRQTSTLHSKLYDGVLEALDYWQVQGVKMALVTNKPEEFIRPLLQRFGMDDYFSVLVGGDSLATRKPSPEPLLHAAQLLKVSAPECVMIGDSVNDVEAARAANMPVICVSYGYNHGEPISSAHPDILVERLDQLIQQ